MPKLPTVAIIGRPNTGKSTLFNRLIGRRRAIVSDTPGTTRDHVAARVEPDNDAIPYLLVDTGGMGGGTADVDLEDDVHQQSLLALEHADVIVFTLNSREELTSSDFEIVDLLRKHKQKHVPVLLVLTKCDDPATLGESLPQYYQLGIADQIIPISAPHRIGIEELEAEINKKLSALNFTKDTEEKPEKAIPRVAIIGKPNVGKSSLVNAFMSENQRQKSPLLVSDIPGTTRDSTDTIIRYHDQEYSFVDTAGIRRKKSTEGEIETYAYFRSIQALEECDIAVLVLDASEPVSKQDKRIAGIAVEEGKGIIILANKIDKLEGDARSQALRHIEYELSFCKYATILPCSANTREGLLKIFDMIEMVQRNRVRRIPTKELNDWYKDCIYGQPMASLISKHITQSEDVPPTFVIFVNDPKRVQVTQLRFLDNNIRKVFGFEGTPIRWITKGKYEDD